MEQTTDAEKAMAVFEFLDFKRKNKVCYICFLIASHLRLFFICYLIVLFLFCSFHLAANYLLSMNFLRWDQEFGFISLRWLSVRVY